MLKNYFKVAIRHLLKNRLYSFINILGLSIGIASTLLILIYILDELSYDRFHPNYQQIYRINVNGRLAGQEFTTNTTPLPMAEALVNEFPEVKNSIRLNTWSNVALKNGDRIYAEDYILAADSNFFSFFNFQLIKGNPKEVLSKPRQIVLSESAAVKYFGDEDPIGKNLILGTEEESYEVTGIAENPPHNSHFHYNVIVSFLSHRYLEENADVWTNNSYYTYMEIDPKADPILLEEKLDELVLKYVGPEIQQYIGATIEEFREQGGKYGYLVQPIADIHLTNEIDDEIEPSGDISNIYAFGVISFLIILIACINFMNIATAKSAERAKEVGIRKTIGALKERMIGQFLSESIILAVISMMLAVLIIYITLPAFNTFSGKQLSILVLLSPKFALVILAITVLIGILAGSYPAFYLTSFNPTEVLKGRMRAGVKSGKVRSTLVVVQFSISIFLIISTLIIYKQMSYMQKRNMGFDKENVVVINNARSLEDGYNGFRNELESYQWVKGLSRSTHVPPHIYNTSAFRPEGARESDYLLAYYFCDFDQAKTLKYEIVEGRFFSEDFPTDSSTIVINEAAVKSFGWKEALGKKILSYVNSDEGVNYEVIGVVRNFNFETLRNDIRPLAMILGRNGNRMTVRLDKGDVVAQLGQLESVWEKHASESAFDYSFIDQNFDALFKTEKKMGEIYVLLTVLAIVIACLGLFGLATFIAEQRTKEIGIRKVMGASVIDITVLLSREFTRLVIISFVLGGLASYFIMNNWLKDFAYRVSPDVIIFVSAGVLSLLIAWLTVSYQSLKAAYSNPTKSLRSE